MQTVGEILRAEREKKGLSIKEVESAISIRALYLNAIEEGNYSIIPGEVYLKGFIRNYAAFLGLDPQRAMDTYRQNKGQTPVVPVEAVRQPEQDPAKLQSQSGMSAKWLTLTLVTVGVVAGLAWWYSGSEKPVTPPPSVVQEQPVPTNPQPVPAPAPKPASKVVVTAKYSAECWTLVTADGKQIYEGIPKNGESLTWEAGNNIVAKFGNAGAVEMLYNGSPAGKMGENGEVVIKTFTLNGITQ